MKKSTKIVLGIVLVLALILGIGYAAITSSELNISGTANAEGKDTEFIVRFKEAPTLSEQTEGVTLTSNSLENLSASFTVDGLTTKGDTAKVTYIVENASPSTSNLDAILKQTKLINSNEDYFTVTSNLVTDTAVALDNGGEQQVVITITLNKTPVEKQSTTIQIGLTATPAEETL